MTNIIIVHGEKPTSSGKIHPNFVERLKVAVKLAKKNSSALLIITGGKTRKNTPSEANMGKEFLKGKIKNKIILEPISKTTIENIKNTKKLVQENKIKIDKLGIVNSEKRLFKTRCLYLRIWPEVKNKITFYPAKDFYPPIFSLWERLSFIVNILDINEQTIHLLTKKFFRS